MEHKRPLESVSDDELLRRLTELMQQSRRVESDLVSHIDEVEERRLYAREASPSMFAYCTDVLHLSEAEAYLRIAAARASRQHPMLLAMLGDGRLHLTGLVKLAPHLTQENRDALLKRATHRSKRQVEELIAEIAPRPDAPAVMRRLPERRGPMPPTTAFSLRGDTVAPSHEPRPDFTPEPEGCLNGGAVRRPELRPDRVGASPAPALRAVVQALAPGRYRVQFTASAQLQEKLGRLRALMRTQVPDGDLAAIIEQAVTEKLDRLEARRFAKTTAPRRGLSETPTPPSSRHIPAAVRRAVYERDASRCRYVNEGGRRCPEREQLEFHHRHPFGLGGDHSPHNIRLMCVVHNAYLAEHDYGLEAMARHRRSRTRASKTAASDSTGSTSSQPPQHPG